MTESCSTRFVNEPTTELCEKHGINKMIRKYVRDGKPWAVVHASCPACDAEIERNSRRQRREALRRELRDRIDLVIPPRYRRARLAHVSRQVVDAVLSAPADGFVLFGRPGVGKTYLMSAYLRSVIASGRTTVMRATWDGLLREIRGTYRRDARDHEEDVLRRYVTAGCLAIEDLGATVPVDGDESAFSIKMLTTILDARLESCLPTHVTTNKSMVDIAKSFDGRIASRLKMLAWIGIGGQDQRKPTARG